MASLYPKISDPIIHQLDVGTQRQHQLYVEECGNPLGTPVIFLHGGPGSGCKPYHRQFFDPDKYRIILFDQRGCGRSTPQGCLEENTTHDLINDMESIRTMLNIERWILFGGSWGVALALLYAETYPDKVTGMILRGAFLASKRDLDWFFADGAGRLFPDEWALFTEQVDEADRSGMDLIEAYHRKLSCPYEQEQIAAAQAWDRWTSKIVTWTLPQNQAHEKTQPELSINKDDPRQKAEHEKLIRSIKLETHYAKNHYFLSQDQLLSNIAQLPNVPVVLIHGRRDITCPLESSWRLHQAIPGSTFTILKEAGHLADEPSMIDALVSATDGMHG